MGPFDHRAGHFDHRSVEQRFGQSVALFLLACGNDHRRAGPVGVVDRADRIAQTRCDVHVAGGELPRCPGKAIGHGDDDRFLQPEYVGQGRMVVQRVHDREFGSTRITKNVSDAFLFEQ